MGISVAMWASQRYSDILNIEAQPRSSSPSLPFPFPFPAPFQPYAHILLRSTTITIRHLTIPSSSVTAYTNIPLCTFLLLSP